MDIGIEETLVFFAIFTAFHNDFEFPGIIDRWIEFFLMLS